MNPPFLFLRLQRADERGSVCIMSLSVENSIAPIDGGFFTIVYISKGAASALVGGKRRVLSSPCCLCLNEKESFVPESSPLEGFTVAFMPSHLNSELSFTNLDGDKTGLSESAVLDRYFLRPFVERDASFGGVFSPGPETDIVIQAKLRRLAADRADSQSPFWPCRQRSSLMDLLMSLVASYRQSSAVNDSFSGDELCARVASWLTVHYSEKVTVARLCDMFETNRTDLSQRFRAATGSSLIDYLSRVRIDMACRMLRETKLPAGDILYRAGFSDAAHFSRTFKKVMKMTPAAYRAANAK